MVSRVRALVRAKSLVKELTWEKASSAQYKDAPHEYAVRDKNPKAAWDELAKLIKQHGEYRKWRTVKFKYFIHDGYAYWIVGIIINRTYEDSLENGGYPSKETRAKISKRFWGGK